MRVGMLALLVTLSGCAWVSKGEYEEYWDADGDGWPLDEDCAPDDKNIHPWAADRRGDGCDADCGMAADRDGDDWPDDADCDADDPTVFPCSPHETRGDEIDTDCDGYDDSRGEDCETFDPAYGEPQIFFALSSCVCPSPAYGGCEALGTKE